MMTCSKGARLANRDGFVISLLCMSSCLKDDECLGICVKECSANIRRVLTTVTVLISFIRHRNLLVETLI